MSAPRRAPFANCPSRTPPVPAGTEPPPPPGGFLDHFLLPLPDKDHQGIRVGDHHGRVLPLEADSSFGA
jgi:hypothetical protein